MYINIEIKIYFLQKMAKNFKNNKFSSLYWYTYSESATQELSEYIYRYVEQDEYFI